MTDNYKYRGSFLQESDVVLISDPCYGPMAHHDNITLKNVKSDSWYCFYRDLNVKILGQIIVIAESIIIPNNDIDKMIWTKVGTVKVNSELVGIFAVEYIEQENELDILDYMVAEICESNIFKITNHESINILNYGVQTITEKGTYDIYVTHEQNEIVGIKIIFLDNDYIEAHKLKPSTYVRKSDDYEHHNTIKIDHEEQNLKGVSFRKCLDCGHIWNETIGEDHCCCDSYELRDIFEN